MFYEIIMIGCECAAKIVLTLVWLIEIEAAAWRAIINILTRTQCVCVCATTRSTRSIAQWKQFSGGPHQKSNRTEAQLLFVWAFWLQETEMCLSNKNTKLAAPQINSSEVMQIHCHRCFPSCIVCTVRKYISTSMRMCTIHLSYIC